MRHLYIRPLGLAMTNWSDFLVERGALLDLKDILWRALTRACRVRELPARKERRRGWSSKIGFIALD